jgi:hypothetical protein
LWSLFLWSVITKCWTISEKYEMKTVVNVQGYHSNGNHFGNGKYGKSSDLLMEAVVSVEFHLKRSNHVREKWK